MTYAMPTVLGHTITPFEWAQMNRMRLRYRHQERQARARNLGGSAFARLGTDHPALLVRELAHDMATTRITTCGNSKTMQQWCSNKGMHEEAARCAEHAARDLAEAKQWAARYVTTMHAALRVARHHITARLVHLLAMLNAHLAPRSVKVAQPYPRKEVALATHLAAQAPPLKACTAVIAASTRPSHSTKGVNN
jgi:hypothetical protein